jgi:hypothetical protein
VQASGWRFADDGGELVDRPEPKVPKELAEALTAGDAVDVQHPKAGRGSSRYTDQPVRALTPPRDDLALVGRRRMEAPGNQGALVLSTWKHGDPGASEAERDE